MKRRLMVVFIYCMFIGLILVESAWSRQVVTDADRLWARDILSQEKALNVEPLPGLVAVLYFLNQSGEADLNPLEKGFALMLITDLSNVNGIQAVERVKLQALAEELGLGASGLVTPGSAPRVGRLLGASNVVSGTILEGLTEKLRILPNIFDIPDEELLNLSPVEGALADLFRLEKEILFAIIEQVLEKPLPDQERTRLMEPMTTSVKAFLFLCRGLAFSDMGNFRKAADFYAKALKEDPNLFPADEFLRELKSRGLVTSKINNRSFLKTLRNSTSLTDRLSPDRPLQRKRTPTDVELRQNLRPPKPDDVDDDEDGYTENQGDCDDADDSIHPGAAEVCGDGIDQDCDGSDFSCDDADLDGDGYSVNQGDCNDEAASIHPGATEACSDGVDQDCDGSDLICPDDIDNDGDGYSVNQGDCNDAVISIHPGATEVCSDGIDQDCDGSDLICPDDVDNDGDGYSLNQGDCDDSNAAIHPGASEICGNDIDENCDGEAPLCQDDIDNDGDGYTENQGDCNDGNASIHPGAVEICSDGIDQDCSGSDISCNDVDNDGDGYTENQGDCNDGNASIHPGAVEICSDGIDQDCSGSDISCNDVDNDGDGYTENQGDCNDGNSSIYPGAPEICNDGIDQDCNGQDETCLDNDDDGYTSDIDCNDNDSSINPGALDGCDGVNIDGIDNNCNGTIDIDPC